MNYLKTLELVLGPLLTLSEEQAPRHRNRSTSAPDATRHRKMSPLKLVIVSLR
jgi:hypothetical protein